MKLCQNLTEIALGHYNADLVLKNASVFNVFTGNFSLGDVAIADGYIAGVGEYSGREELDLAGKYLTPGFIDAHVHIESAMVSPAHFACVVVPAGTTTVVADPHELANVLGEKGIQYMLDATEELPLNVYMMLPSCVPATDLEHSGAILNAEHLAKFMQHPRVLGLGEVMNYPGVLAGSEDLLRKIALAQGKRVDGHSPGLAGKGLTAYIAAGIQSDHECMTPGEAQERLAQGMHVMLREGSAAKNLRDLLSAVTAHTMPQCLLCTDDRHPKDLIELGHINQMVKLAIEAGIDISWVLKMATINAANYFGLGQLGAVAPGRRADLLVFEDLKEWRPLMVFKDGHLVAKNGKALFRAGSANDQAVQNTMNLAPIEIEKLKIKATSSTARVIGLIPGQLATSHLALSVRIQNGEFVADPENDILKLAVWERHHNTGNVGVGLLKGLGLKSGAIASTIAHDSHNLIVAGANDEDMLLAVRELERMQGGIIIVERNKILGSMPLPLAGLMTDKDIGQVQLELLMMQSMAWSLGMNAGYDPFMTLAFLSLPVIPALKLTDVGLVDVMQFKLVPVSVEQTSEDSFNRTRE